MRAWFWAVFGFQFLSACLFGQDSIGSGFVIRSDGYVLTNRHVIDNATGIEVMVPGVGQFHASVVADDSYKDLALLKIGAVGLDALPIAESKGVSVLDPVIVLGYPYGLALGSEVSASEGKVNAIRDEGKIPLLQIDANVNPGNSGGPALNDRGEVVGVVVSKLNVAYFLKTTGSIPERVNFAIPIDEARGIIRQAYPLGFNASARTDRLSSQQVFDQARKGTVLIAAWSGGQAAAPEPTPPKPRIASLGIANFVKAYIESGNTGSPDDETAFYARRVNYFDNGFVDRGFIVGDVANYNHRWPIRSYRIVTGPEISATTTEGVYDVVCRIRFQVQNAEKGVEGTVLQRMLIDQVEDGFVILSVTSSTEQRRVTQGQRALRAMPSDALGRPARTNGTGR
jgi:hypothetical protein